MRRATSSSSPTAGSRTVYRTAAPSLRASTMFLARSTARCWDTVGWSRPIDSCSSCTPRSPRTSISRMRMRTGWASALKNSALNAWSGPVGGIGFI